MPRSAEGSIRTIQAQRGPFVIAAETTRTPMIFTDAKLEANCIDFANDSFLALTGYTRNQILGRSLSTVLVNDAESDNHATLLAAMAAGEDCVVEIDCRRIDGTTFVASVFLAPIRNSAGALTHNFLSVHPLDKAYRRFSKRWDELHQLYGSAPGFIATVEGSEHRFTFANPSYEAFVGRCALVGRTVAEALPEVVAQGFVDILDRVYRTGVPYRGVAIPFDMTDTATGQPIRRYADFVYQPVQNDDGNIVGLFCEGYDVTAQREATISLATVQAELIHLSRVSAMGAMAMTLAHELQQPLAAIANYTAGGLRLLSAEGQADLPVAQAFHAIDDASQQITGIIRTLRDLTRRGEVNAVPFDLKLAIDDCLRLIEATTAATIDIIDLTPPGFVIRADRVQIQQVVINLVRNACDAVEMSIRKRVEIDATVHGSDHVISVRDTGPGVSAGAAQDIFSWSSSSKEGGMGLGLSICRTIVEAHGGRIWLEHSSAEGSVFCFSLPADSADVRPPVESFERTELE